MARTKIRLHLKPVDMLSTGTSLLNLGLSDQAFGGLYLGTVTNIVGEKQSGKTAIGLSTCAEANQDKRFDDYDLFFDDVEAANLFDIDRLFGSGLRQRLKAPYKNKYGAPRASATIDEFQQKVHELLDKERPFIYILDSLDALDSLDDQKKLKEKFKARKKGEKVSGSYGMAKPKLMSETMRQIVRRVKESRSIVIILSQTRTAVNASSFAPKRRAGGDSLDFYATNIMWLATVKTLRRTVRRFTRQIGNVTRCRISKCKQTGKMRIVEFPIFYDYGIDDLGSCVDFLVDARVWRKKGKSIIARGLGGLAAPRSDLLRIIEDRNLQNKVREMTQVAWTDIERSFRLGRRPKYA